MKKYLFLLMLVVVVLPACGTVKDVKDAVETVNESVQFLTEISESGTWNYISAGMEALDQQPGGFASTITLTEGTTDDTGQQLVESLQTTVWTISTDDQNETQAQVTRGDEVHEFITVQEKIYRVEDGSYVCVAYEENGTFYQVANEEAIFSTSAGEIFLGYNFLTAGLQALSVAEKVGNEDVNGVPTTSYNLVSKLTEAKEILSKFPSADLQSTLDSVPEFYVSGALNVADSNQALMRFEAQYGNLDDKTGNQFRFEVTELGNQPDITAPDPAQITTPCENGTPVANNN